MADAAPPAGAVFREANTADVASLAALARRAFCETFTDPGVSLGLNYPPEDLAAFLDSAYAPSAVSEWLADKRALVFVCEFEGELVGYAHAGPCSLPQPGATELDGELKRLYVLRAHQGKRIGPRLMRASLDFFSSGQRVFLGVWSGNLKARAFYAKFGFRDVGAYKFAVGEALDDEVIMGRP